MEVAANLLRGAPLQLLTEAVKMCLDTSSKFRDLLQEIDLTLDCLNTPIYQEIINVNQQLNLPNTELVSLLEVKVPEGKVLVDQLKRLSRWNIRIWGNWCNCIEPNYARKLSELDRALKVLLAHVKVEETLIQRLMFQRLDELQRDVADIRQVQLQNREQALEMQQQVMQSTQMNGGQQVGGGGGGRVAAPVPALGASFGMLFDAVTKVKVKNRMCKRILTELESTLDFLKPFIQELAEFHKVLHLPQQQLENYITQMNMGVQLVQKCSEVRKRANYKNCQYTKDIFGLDESLQKLFLELKGQVQKKVKEAMDTVNNVRAELKLLDESGVVRNDEIEIAGSSPVFQLPNSPSVEIDLQKNMQGTSDATRETLVNPTGIPEGVEPAEGSDVAHELIQSETRLPRVGLYLLNVQEAGDVVETTDSIKYTEMEIVENEGIEGVDSPTGNLQGTTHSVRNVGETSLPQIEESGVPQNQPETAIPETEPPQPTVSFGSSSGGGGGGGSGGRSVQSIFGQPFGQPFGREGFPELWSQPVCYYKEPTGRSDKE